MRKLALRPRAQLDLESIFIHISLTLGSPQAASNTLDIIYDAFDRIAEMPTLGMVFTHDELEREYRRMLVKNHWVYYSYDDKMVTIWRVFHTRQDIATQTIVEL